VRRFCSSSCDSHRYRPCPIGFDFSGGYVHVSTENSVAGSIEKRLFLFEDLAQKFSVFIGVEVRPVQIDGLKGKIGAAPRLLHLNVIRASMPRLRGML